MAKAAEEEAVKAEVKRKEEEWHAPGFEPRSEGTGGAGAASGATAPSGHHVTVEYVSRSALVNTSRLTRLSFGGFNKEVEQQNKERRERERRVKAMAAAARAQTTDVSDAEMANTLGKAHDGAKGKKKKGGGKSDGGAVEGFARDAGDEGSLEKSGGFKKPPPMQAVRREALGGKRSADEGGGSTKRKKQRF